jgi:nicotinamidase/pyrazinamidase
MTKTLLWDVDTQHDFIDPDGKLSAPGATAILPNLKRLTNANHKDLIHAGSVDAHTPRDSEFGTWPPHCVYGTPGQLKVPESTRGTPIHIPSRRLTREQLYESITSSTQLLFEKQHNDVRTNPNVKPFLTKITPEFVAVYGVATDICVDLAVKYIVELGYKTIVVVDAIKEIDAENAERCLAHWQRMGIRFMKTSQLLENLCIKN